MTEILVQFNNFCQGKGVTVTKFEVKTRGPYVSEAPKFGRRASEASWLFIYTGHAQF